MDLILVDLEIPKDFSILQNQEIWIADTGALNDGTTHKKGITNSRKDESSMGTMRILGDDLKN